MGDGDLDEGTRMQGFTSSTAGDAIERVGVQIDDGCGTKEADRLRASCTVPKEVISGGSSCGMMVVGCRSSSLGFSNTRG